MVAAVELLSVQALADIRDRLTELSGKVRSHTERARDQLRRQSNWLADVGRERRDARSAAYRAVAELDEDADGEAERRQLEEAEDAVNEFDRVATEYEAASHRFAAELECVVEQGNAIILTAGSRMEAKIDAAHAYLSIHVPPTEGSRAAAAAHGAGLQLSTPAEEGDIDGYGRLPAGFSWITLGQLTEENFIIDTALFKHLGREEMAHGIMLLRDEILPRLNQDPALGRDDFARIDCDRDTAWTAGGFVHPDSLAVVWDAFLDPRRQAEVIVIDSKADGTIDVINGRHRLGLARELGLEALPCKILGKHK